MRIGLPSWVALVCACACACVGEKWRWPDGASTVRIDTKVRFVDSDHDKINDKSTHNPAVQADEPQFQEPTNTEGFYNRPPGVGRYPVHVQTHQFPYRVDPHTVSDLHKGSYSDGTLDSLQFCKCVVNPDCNPSADSAKACGVGKYLCCYKRGGKTRGQNSEYFNEVEDERPILLPNFGKLAGPFPPPPASILDGNFGPGHVHDAAVLGVINAPAPAPPRKPVIWSTKLVGPSVPTGIRGPDKGVLVGPDGPTGYIGPGQENLGILVGPNGPTGSVGPTQNSDVLVGPGGPTGIIGPAQLDPSYYQDGQRLEMGSSESAQRGILVGPGGPTGIIGPGGYGRRPVLVGPGGPTGIIGPYGRGGGRPILYGNRNPTGITGPVRRPYYGCSRSVERRSSTAVTQTSPAKKRS